MTPVERIRIESGAIHLHRLGARAIAELLLELADADAVLARLDRYRRFSPDLLRTVGGDRFAPRLSAAPDDRQRA